MLKLTGRHLKMDGCHNLFVVTMPAPNYSETHGNQDYEKTTSQNLHEKASEFNLLCTILAAYISCQLSLK